jgi:hypothetical protein
MSDSFLDFYLSCFAASVATLGSFGRHMSSTGDTGAACDTANSTDTNHLANTPEY